jgi:hypothetical protein
MRCGDGGDREGITAIEDSFREADRRAGAFDPS